MQCSIPLCPSLRDWSLVKGHALIMYTCRGVGRSTPMHTNAYKGRVSDHDQNMHFDHTMFIENATLSEPFKPH